MKKILVVLLVLAVAGGVFAQENKGEWSITGKAEIGTFTDFNGHVSNQMVEIDDPLNPGRKKLVQADAYINPVTGAVVTATTPGAVAVNEQKKAAMTIASGYFQPYGYYGPVNGALTINYKLGGLGAYLTFDLFGDHFIGGFNYGGENFKFQVETNMFQIINGYANTTNGSGQGLVALGSGNGNGPQYNNLSSRRLWGSYELLNKMILLEVAYNSRDNGDSQWVSDKAGAFYDHLYGALGYGAVSIPLESWAGQNTFTKVDHHNYLLTDVRLSNFSFGIMLPHLFGDNNVPHDRMPPYKINDTSSWNQGQFGINGNQYNADGSARTYGYDAQGNLVYAPTGFSKALGRGNAGGNGPGSKSSFELVNDIMKQSVFGLKFAMSPVEFAAQFKLQDYGMYFGGKFTVSSVTFGLSFMGIFPTIEADQKVKVGTTIAYNPGTFGVTLKGWYGMNGLDKSLGAQTQIGVEPSFFYNVIPTHLRFQTDVGFYFNGTYKIKNITNTGLTGVQLAGIETEKVTKVLWGVQPQLFWNFKGTGAGSYYGMDTGMIFRYRMVRDTTNEFDATFRWQF